MTTLNHPGRGNRKPPAAPPKVATQPLPEQPHHFVFSNMIEGVPASLVIGVDKMNMHDAIGAAYLVAEKFSEWAMKELSKPKPA